MQKKAWKPSQDPAQNKIRQQKADANKLTSELIDDLIQFKKLVNGWSSKFYNEKSSIKEPIPADPTTIIGSLALDFSDLAKRWKSIIDEQSSYSKTRKRSTKTSSPQDRVEMLKMASNPLSRMISKIHLPFGNKADENRYRISLLNQFATMWKDLFELEGFVLSSDKEAGYKAEKMSKKILNDIKNSNKMFNIYKKTYIQEDLKEDESNYVEKSKTVGASAYKFYEDFLNFKNNYEGNLYPEVIRELAISKKMINEVDGAYARIEESIDNIAANSEYFIKKYKDFLDDTNKKVSKLVGENVSEESLTDLLDFLIENADSMRQKKKASEDMVALNIKIADNSFNKFLKKIKNKIMPGTSGAVRIEAYNKAKEIRDDINKLMNSLEKSINVSEIDQFYSSVYSKYDALNEAINILVNKFVSDEYYNDLKLDDKDKKYLKERSRRYETNRLLRKML
jgi:uncharacterized protein YoxC